MCVMQRGTQTQGVGIGEGEEEGGDGVTERVRGGLCMDTSHHTCIHHTSTPHTTHAYITSSTQHTNVHNMHNDACHAYIPNRDP